MVAKKFQNPSGGLNDAGRKKFGVKRPVKSGVNPRRISLLLGLLVLMAQNETRKVGLQDFY